MTVQFCAKECEVSESWKDAEKPKAPGVAVFPDPSQKGNNLLFGEQNRSDWTMNTMVVPIPSEMKTATFRLRFVPTLGQDVRVAIDDISIREVSQ